MERKRFKCVSVNKDDHKHIDRSAKWIRERFPCLVKILTIFIKD
jgi:hypothetical protein